jgi:ABC-type antimicrobial peptide transport system permease subunit
LFLVERDRKAAHAVQRNRPFSLTLRVNPPLSLFLSRALSARSRSNVTRRTNEIGIRLALGAQGASVLRMIIRESLVLLAIGTGLGLPLAMMATRVIKQQLFAMDAIDPISFAAALVVVSLMTVIASWLPARRAAKVDPVTALRCE